MLPPASDITARPGSRWLAAGRRSAGPVPVRYGRRERHCLFDQLLEDFGGALLACDKADTLPGHQGAGFDIAVDRRAAQRPGPEVLDLELRFLLRDFAACEPVDDPALHGNKPLGCRIGERPDRDHRKARIELNRGHRIARRRADEGLLEARMSNRFAGRRQNGCRAGPRPLPSRDRRASPRHGRSRRRRIPGCP